MDLLRTFLARVGRTFSSRKVRIAAATIGVSIAAEFGLQIGHEFMLTIVGIAIALILAVAHEDSGQKSRPSFKRDNHF
ncbi:MAG: hypothetical protein ACYTHJ_01095 [Planctomycetota bacterium]|jgi:hypothetical protein